jgi:hypothetical protein
MIVKEFFMTRTDGVNLFRTYSDNGFYIQKENTEEIYAEAIDVENASFTYIETNEYINPEEHEEDPVTPEEDDDNWEEEASAAYLKGVNEA